MVVLQVLCLPCNFKGYAVHYAYRCLIDVRPGRDVRLPHPAQDTLVARQCAHHLRNALRPPTALWHRTSRCCLESISESSSCSKLLCFRDPGRPFLAAGTLGRSPRPRASTARPLRHVLRSLHLTTSMNLDGKIADGKAML